MIRISKFISTKGPGEFYDCLEFMKLLFCFPGWSGCLPSLGSVLSNRARWSWLLVGWDAMLGIFLIFKGRFAKFQREATTIVIYVVRCWNMIFWTVSKKVSISSPKGKTWKGRVVMEHERTNSENDVLPFCVVPFQRVCPSPAWAATAPKGIHKLTEAP